MAPGVANLGIIRPPLVYLGAIVLGLLLHFAWPVRLVFRTAKDTYGELCCYTLGHGDPAFIHRHVVDAFAAQNADESTRPIQLAFALIGLYLHVEKEFSLEDTEFGLKTTIKLPSGGELGLYQPSRRRTAVDRGE